jgi:hypothetical protein
MSQQRKSRLFLAIAASATLGIATLAAFTQIPAARAAEPAATTDATTQAAPAERGMGRGMRHGRGEKFAALKNSPEFAVMRNLRSLERLYLIDGRAQEIPALYRDVLNRTQNPALRQFAYGRIARNELKPGDADKAIATLRQSLDENLQRLTQ